MSESLDQMVGSLPEEEAEAIKELDKRLLIARALFTKHFPNVEFENKDHANVFFEFFERVDDFLDAVHDVDDD